MVGGSGELFRGETALTALGSAEKDEKEKGQEDGAEE